MLEESKQEQVIKELIRRVTQEKYADVIVSLKIHENKIVGGRVEEIKPKLG